MPLDFPANPVNGQVYASYIYNSAVGAWQSTEDSATVAVTGPTAPVSANNGDIWYNTNTGVSYIYYSDGTSSQWVEIISSALPALNTKADLSGATFTGNVTAPRFISTQATGTAPLTITSTTAVTNLNADLLDGQHASAFAASSHNHDGSAINAGTVAAARLPNLQDLNGTLDVASGGTGATTVDAAQSALGVNVLQTVFAEGTSGEIGNSTTTYANTGLSASITPSSTNSKILIFINHHVLKNNTNASNQTQIRILRNSTEIKAFGTMTSGTAVELTGGQMHLWQDSPSTTSAITYSTQFRNAINSSVVVVNRGFNPQIILMEIR
jgi:hypothetical protein